jgi:cell shape-determining protein MreD
MDFNTFNTLQFNSSWLKYEAIGILVTIFDVVVAVVEDAIVDDDEKALVL